MEVKTLPDSPDDISTFYIQATESIQQRWPRTLKQGDTFALFDALGDCGEDFIPQLADDQADGQRRVGAEGARDFVPLVPEFDHRPCDRFASAAADVRMVVQDA